MKKAFLALSFLIFISGMAEAGTLYGIILKEDGKPLSKAKIKIDGKETATNEFGGYSVEMPDGEASPSFTIDGRTYSSGPVTVGAKTKQNWRVDPKDGKLVKIK